MNTSVNYKSAQYILGSIGTLSGLYYAFSKNKGALSYIGFALVGGIAGGILGSLYDNSIKPVVQKALPKLENDVKNEMAQVHTTRPMQPSISVESASMDEQMMNFL